MAKSCLGFFFIKGKIKKEVLNTLSLSYPGSHTKLLFLMNALWYLVKQPQSLHICVRHNWGCYIITEASIFSSFFSTKKINYYGYRNFHYWFGKKTGFYDFKTLSFCQVLIIESKVYDIIHIILFFFFPYFVQNMYSFPVKPKIIWDKYWNK